MLQIPDDFSVSSRDRTMLLMRLNIAAYPSCSEKQEHGHQCTWSQDTIQTILDKGQSIYGSNLTDFDEEIAALQTFESENWNALTFGGGISFSSLSIPDNTARYDVGVSAMQWDIRNTTILVFRGTFSHGDYANIEHWMLDYLLEKSTDRMKQAWVDDAGLEWTEELQKRTNHDDTWAKVALRAHEFWNEDTFPKELEESVKSQVNIGLTLQEAQETGYWKLTKYIVDQVYAQTVSSNKTLILTGHSQGGTRAQLASMYLEQEYGVQLPTVSFAATGAACMARRLFATSANLLDDVNPFTLHSQIVEYVHPLDPWGNSMLGEDDGGKICHLNTSTTALEYCGQIYGWRGPILVANENSPIADQELKRNFQLCRYFTHNARAMFVALSETLKEDGSTQGGCFNVLTIPRDDPNGTCPTGNITIREKSFLGLVLLVTLVLLLLPIGCCYRAWKRRKQTRRQSIGFQVVGLESGMERNGETFDTELDGSIELPDIS